MAAYSLDATYNDLPSGIITESRKHMRGSYERITHAVNQLDDADLWWRPIESMNAIGNLMLHLAGNLGQWVVNGVANTPSGRDRQSEFDQREPFPRDVLLGKLRDAVDQADATIAGVADNLLDRRRIQGFDTTVLTAVFHAVTHFEGHAQEIIFIARCRLGDRYVFLWTPKSPEQGAPATG